MRSGNYVYIFKPKKISPPHGAKNVYRNIEVVLGTWDYSSKLKGGDQYNESPADQ